MLLAALLAQSPRTLPSSDSGSVTLTWASLTTSGIRLRANGVTALDSARPTVAIEEHVFGLRARSCPPHLEDACRVEVTVEVERYGIGADSATAAKSVRDIGSGSRSQVRLTPAGTWESADDSSSNYASGFVVEQLAAWLPLELPRGPIRAGSSWPVHLFSRRPNRRVGILQEEFIGRATLDSVTGEPDAYAWLSVTGTQVGQAGSSVGNTTLRSTIRWSLRYGAPEMVVTLTEGSFDAAPNEFSSTRQLHSIRTRYEIRLLRPDSVRAAP